MFIVIELQANGDSVANLVTSHFTREEAYSKYHAVLSAAAISAVEIHSAVILNERGQLIDRQSFDHPVQED